jgi:hypothetical protein
MARKINRPPAPAAAPEAEDDLDVLHPERVLHIAGQDITVREYGHLEWLRLLPAAAPLVADIAALLGRGDDPDYEAVLLLLAERIDGVLPLVLQAAGMDRDAFEALDPADGEALLLAWWSVNGRFFVQRAATRAVLARLKRPSAGVSSTPPSSPTATAPETSPATPPAS